MKIFKNISMLLCTFAIGSCGGGYLENNTEVVAYAPDNTLRADIKWTTYGVPHITSDSLEGVAFGSGYATAQDNICTIADQMVRVKSLRSKFFGPDEVPGSGDAAHITSDFGILALKIMDSATRLYPTLSSNSKALIEGYVQGYNKYLRDTGVENIAPECAGEPWVMPITKEDLTAYIFTISQQTSGLKFIELAFLANPDTGSEYLPYIKDQPNNTAMASLRSQISRRAEHVNPSLRSSKHLGSNGWGLGSDKTENGKGMLLANPHFPLSGNLRFWQSHITIPGVLDVAGASLLGFPAIINIGFNENIAWTHTLSSSKRFAVFQLELGEQPLEYMYDGESRKIRKESFELEVNYGGRIMSITKDYFYSHHGLMVEAPPEMGLFPWGRDVAFTLNDAVQENTEVLDHWLAINLSKNLDEFQDSFKRYNGIPWANTIYADDKGNSFYIDKSRVLGFNEEAQYLMETDPELTAYRSASGFNILPGDSSLFEPLGLNDYVQVPKLFRTDFVQNSNDSYWATNPAEVLTGYSNQYGLEGTPLSFRTRMGLTLIGSAGGEDGKFTLNELETALLGNQTYLSENILDDLLVQCFDNGDNPVMLSNGQEINLLEACQILADWDRTLNTASIGGHIFREFAYGFDPEKHFVSAFDPEDPVNTPAILSQSSDILAILARAVANIEAAGISLDSAIGDIQFTEKLLADGELSYDRLPWPGSVGQTGGFNVFAYKPDDDTLFPVYQYSPALDVITGSPLSSGLTRDGYAINYGSSWMYVVNFTDSGPVARGLLTSSQSANSESAHFDDQGRYYSANNKLRPIAFTEEDIARSIIDEISIETR